MCPAAWITRPTEITSYKTNNFTFAEITVNAAGVPNPPVYSTVVSPVPVTDRSLDYAALVAAPTMRAGAMLGDDSLVRVSA